MTGFDPWIIAAVVAAFSLLASLRQSLPWPLSLSGLNPVHIVTHPIWLIPLILAVPMAVGLMLAGLLPVSPLALAEEITASHGLWAGRAALLVALAAWLWLLLTPAMAALKFAPATSRAAYRPLPVVNLAFGGAVLALLAFTH